MITWTGFPDGGGLPHRTFLIPPGTPPEVAPPIEPGVVWVLGSYPPETYYRTAGGDVTARAPLPVTCPTTIAADGVAEVTLVPLPNPTRLVAEDPAGQRYEEVITDGDVVLTFSTQGRWKLWLLAGAEYLVWEAEIDAT